ncbi:MAG: gliding motility-associated C-terminal domain-containing protein [Crocinitomicaceae bacterium]|nr:gliding motility-associated C-terminal domain-containing protein [Crocinitomicaceae bacterium]
MKKLNLLLVLLVPTVLGFSQMTTRGTAAQYGGSCNCYQLTDSVQYQVGAIWSQNTIDLVNDFDMSFQVTVGALSPWGADGMAFVLQENPSGLGDIGHSLGVEPPIPDLDPISANRVAVEIDTWGMDAQVPSDPTDHHMGISSGPVVDHDLYPPTTFPGNVYVADNLYHTLRIQWNYSLKILAVFWDGTPMMALNNDLPTNIFGGNTVVYWGFTGATAFLKNFHRVCVNSTISSSADQTTVCPGIDINFSDASTSPIGIIDGWSWDFGDGSPADNNQNTSHSYVNPGTYNAVLTMTDGFGCDYTQTHVITILDSLTLTMDSSNVTCFGANDGMVEVASASGTAPHTYQWTPAGSTAQITGLGAGQYSVEVTDNLGCVGIDSVTITEPLAMISSMDSTMNDCYAGNAGSATVTVSNGTLPYTYAWNDGASQSTATASALVAGTYTVVVTDNNGCQITETVTITENTDIVSSSVATNDTGGGVGSIDVTVNGGISPYSYDWSSGQSTEDLTDLTAGQYQLIITDALGCFDTLNAEVLSDFNVELPTAMSPNGDNLNDTYFIKGIIAYPDNSLIITNRWGNVVYKVEDYDNSWNGVNMKGENLPEGTYYAVFETESGEIWNSYFEIRRQ